MSKASLRTIVRARLEADRQTLDEKSAQIWRLLSELTAFDSARKRRSLMCYVDFRNEVRTAQFFSRFLNAPNASIIVPFCEDGEIVPFRLWSLDDLEPGYKGIPEPKAALRRESDRTVAPESVETAIVPGLAFDTNGNRLGRGAGFYDRFLPTLPPTATIIGLALECQVFESIPVEPHDKRINILVTETGVRHCRD